MGSKGAAVSHYRHDYQLRSSLTLSGATRAVVTQERDNRPGQPLLCLVLGSCHELKLWCGTCCEGVSIYCQEGGGVGWRRGSRCPSAGGQPGTGHVQLHLLGLH